VNYLVELIFLRSQYTTAVHILTHSVNIAFVPKSGFKMRPVYNSAATSWNCSSWTRYPWRSRDDKVESVFETISFCCVALSSSAVCHETQVGQVLRQSSRSCSRRQTSQKHIFQINLIRFFLFSCKSRNA